MADQKDEIAFFFHKAYEDKVDINLTFLLDKCQFSAVRGPCVMIKNKHFVVRVPLEKLQRTQIIWGAEVSGFFLLRLDDVKAINFKTRLVRLYNAPPDSMFLICPLPAFIDHGQRRNSRRVDIDRETATGFGIWYGSMEGGDLEKIPQQIWRPFRNEDCELGELSASGMRLDFLADNPLVGQLSQDDPVLLKGDFGAPNKPAPLFILGSVVRKMPRKDKEGLMSVGCHFRSWRKIVGPDSDQWFKADEQDGIMQVNQWLGRNFRGIAARMEEQKKKA